MRSEERKEKQTETERLVLRGMGAEDEREPLWREQLFSETAAGQISECMTRGTSEAWVHTLTHKHTHTHTPKMRDDLHHDVYMHMHVYFVNMYNHAHIDTHACFLSHMHVSEWVAAIV